jgi:hypothetical protein
LALTCHTSKSVNSVVRILAVESKLFFWNTSGTSEFILIPHEANCKSDKSYEMILYFSLIFNHFLQIIVLSSNKIK